MKHTTTEPTRILPCPACRKPTRWEGNPDRPFCSERCRLMDLGKWANEEYRVAAEDVTAQDDES